MTQTRQIQRPLSPHLTAYKPEITSTLSILHRATGIALFLGLCLLAWWVVAVTLGGTAYDWTAWALRSVPGQICLVLWSLTLAFHLLNGVRHLSWDAGYGFTMQRARQSGWAVLLATVVLTAVFWLLVWF